MKVRDGEGKYLLKKAVSELLPAGDHLPAEAGLLGPGQRVVPRELGERAQREIRELVARRARPARLRRDRPALAGSTAPGRGDWAFQLWNIYNVSAWHDYWVAGRVPAG